MQEKWRLENDICVYLVVKIGRKAYFKLILYQLSIELIWNQAMQPNFDDIHSENLEFLEKYSQEDRALPAATEDERYKLYGHLDAHFSPFEAKKSEPSARLEKIYSAAIGYEFYPFCPTEISDYIVGRIEPLEGKFGFSRGVKQQILHLLNRAEAFETFLHTKYVGQKRFSLEGAETLIPMLALLLEKDITELIIGMPHRGRLNVLSNILNKSYGEIFSEFEDVAVDTFETSGDVKYHKGYSSKVAEKDVVLVANPSHLESVDAVVEGFARARGAFPVLVHGDAAISGQGVVYETLQMAKLDGYTTGGTIHIVINNHIGFTTLPKDGRSTRYCTDIAKTFGAPIFHVNAEDPESCIFAMELAFEIRQKFGSDVFIDLNCYRKYGHNEGDEPAFTQPLIYQDIRKKASIRAQYHDKLVQEGVEVELLDEEFKSELQKVHSETTIRAEQLKKEIPARKIQTKVAPEATGVPESRIRACIQSLCMVPEGFTLHPRLKTLIEARKTATEVDWAFAEGVAFGTLLQENVPIRLAGQDSRRGTFSQRHGIWVDQKTAEVYVPHTNIHADFELIDSFLSEYAALGFEYGYSLGRPEALVLWEAQFGDFANGAQIVIDQYIAPGEQKWNVHSGLTLLLPHGYEGQGPEHSSGRIERFLTLCAEDNMSVCYPTTPAQYFHLLRRQVNMHKPLIVFTPKALLRAPECRSSLAELTEGTFEQIIDPNCDVAKVDTLIFCSGGIYYDLAPHVHENMALIRIEQLYPLASEQLKAIIERYTRAKTFIWAQEEPYNMGARGYIQEPISCLLPKGSTLEYRGREASSSPACGSHLVHEKEHTMIIDSLFKGKQ